MRLSTRYKLLQETINRLAPITTALNNTGISLRFINHRRNIASFNDLRTSDEIAAQLQNLHLRGSTPIGTELRAKVLEPFLLQKARDGTLDRPVLITIITDGEPAGESRGTLKKVILDTKIALQSLKNRDGEVYGDRAVIFQINYVGSSAESQDYIAELDRDPDVGHLIFCNKEKIDDTMQRLESDAARNEWVRCGEITCCT
ncbi:hypothetical protein EDC01DRAFT_371642 [Geopyxis carbonaria]|nr:hypothetical protein EDC01DRAFT_371642 [Geopyxis carbonaria]